MDPRPTRPSPATGDPHLDLLRGAIEQHLYPYGDLAATPARPTATYQLSLLERGLQKGMTDKEVSAFLSANLMCGGTTVYRGIGVAPQPIGYVTLAGRRGDRDVMGRAPFYWYVTVAPRPGSFPGDPVATWEHGAVFAALRRAFGIPFREEPLVGSARPEWEGDQALLF